MGVPAANLENPTSPLARAIAVAGGRDKLAHAIGVSGPFVSQWKANVRTLTLDHCPAIENATGVRCDDLRPDVIWHRDGAGEVIGYSCPIDGSTRGTVEAALRGGTESSKQFAGSFGSLPVLNKQIFAINPEVTARWLLSEASCILNALIEVASDGVETPITAAAAWLMRRNLECVQALVEEAETRDEVRA